MDSQTPSTPNPNPQGSVDPQVAQAASTLPPKRDSFVMSFIPRRKNLSGFLPVVLVLVLVIILPLTVVLVRQRQLGESQGQTTFIGCACESITSNKDLNNLNIGDVIVFTGMGKTDELDYDIGTMKFVVKKNGEEVAVEERLANLDYQEGELKFYKSDEFSYTIQEYGDYEVTIQVSCPDGWKD